MPTFSSSDTRVLTIRASQDRVAEALTKPERIAEALGDQIESSVAVDAQTARWIRKPVEELGVRFRGDYTVHYEHDGHGKVTWHSVGTGNMRTHGEARVSPAPDGTRLEYSEAVECDMEVNRFLAPLLRPIVERKMKSAVGEYLGRIKAILERGQPSAGK